MSVEIKQYSKQQLRQALEKDSLWQGDVIPISKHRALSFVHNPRAKEDDLVLIVAFEGNNVIGFRGALPDTFYIGNKKHPFVWGSSWWVAESHLGKELGTQMLNMILEYYKDSFGSRHFFESAKSLMSVPISFLPLSKKKGLFLGWRLNRKVLLRSIWLCESRRSS